MIKGEYVPMKTLNDVKCFLLDMDGTIYLGNILLEGSLEFLKAVVDSGRDFMSRSWRRWVFTWAPKRC